MPEPEHGAPALDWLDDFRGIVAGQDEDASTPGIQRKIVNGASTITIQSSTQTGQIQLKILFKKRGRIPITEFGYSYFSDISKQKNYNEAKITAFKSAYKMIPFSPDGFEIIGEKFIYIDSRNFPLSENSQYARMEN